MESENWKDFKEQDFQRHFIDTQRSVPPVPLQDETNSLFQNGSHGIQRFSLVRCRVVLKTWLMFREHENQSDCKGKKFMLNVSIKDLRDTGSYKDSREMLSQLVYVACCL